MTPAVGEPGTTDSSGGGGSGNWQTGVPAMSLPKGGGAIRGIGEKFSANPVTGTGNLVVPIAVSASRQGFAPQLTLTYDSGSGNGPFGLGWTLSLPSITRRTDKGLPQYQDAVESDTFILSGAEDLVPALVQSASGGWARDTFTENGHVVTRYAPRIEGLFSRIERWTRSSDGDTYWRSISKDNVTTFYGKTPQSRITDPADSSRIFTWLICESFDDKGNGIVYEYAAEDSASVDLAQANERNRTDGSRSAHRHLKRVKYGNTPSLLVEPDLTQLSWLFEVVFDYGEGHYVPQAPDAQGREFVTASPTGTQSWPVRQDPFSRYRGCFEVRTYRLCRRALMFHHFPAELGVQDYLVRATEFSYRESPIASFIVAVTQSGFVRQDDGTYLKRSLPTLELEYSQAQVQQDVREVDAESLANLPSSVDGSRYQWLDLDGEGVQGVLAEQDDGWYYKRNLSPLTFGFAGGEPTSSARFEPLSEVTRLPAFAEPNAPRHQFLDLAGDGQLDCLVLERPVAGFFERTQDEDWESFTPLPSQPNVDWNDPNLRFVDLDGDGHADVLITENQVLTWYRSLAEGGFAEAIRVSKARDEERGPAIVFADGTQSIFLADMSGDGLSDIVRIHNGEVCYWPSLGYGQFGQKVSMDRAPWFDTAELFDPRRIRLADIDGSGTTDVIYLAPEGVRLYFNQSGNALSEPEAVAAFPPIDNLSTVQAVDLLGNGTACLVWTSSLPGDVGHSMRYIDLMGGEKPHLLVRSRNNLGAETRTFYAPSTKFYLADRQAGQPWVTRLPFPVHVVERVETHDWVSRNRFVTRYAYHHGFYDGAEREFRGFGMVEQYDTEELGALNESAILPDAANIDAASYVPPVLTKTWFHTGADLEGPRVSRVYEEEYYRESDLSEGVAGLSDAEFDAMLLPDTVLPADLAGEEIREAIRSLKGATLRQEVYALDGTEEADRPYSVSERNYTIKRLQPFGGNRHAVFFTHGRESIDFHYERKLYDVGGRTLADPRVTHSMILAVDDFGNELQSVAIGYGRRHDDPDPLLTADDSASQSKIHVTVTGSTYTNPILADDAYRPPLPAETRTYELIKVAPDRRMPDVTNLFRFDEISAKLALAADGQHDLPYEDVYAVGALADQPYRRLIELARTLYRKNDLTDGLPLGTVESLALPFESYKLAFTTGLLALYQRDQQALSPDPVSVLRDEGGYVLSDDQKALGLFPSSDPDGSWWIPSGRIFHSPGTADSPAHELATAQPHFYLARRFRDPFGNDTTVLHDALDLLVLETEDALQNKVTAGERASDSSITNRNDYRVLQPALLTDPNGNRSEVMFDGLALVAGTAVMGKSTETLGDSLTGLIADLTQQDIDQFFTNPKGPPAASLLGSATSRFVYDLGRFTRPTGTPNAPSPTCAATIVRETHASDLGQGQASKLQVSVSFSDGFGREIQRKMQAEPGPVTLTGPKVDPRWVGSGWTIFNNKGKPVRQYEPFFDDTHDFRFAATAGVSPTLFYDPASRVVATLHPNHTYEKVVFDPWKQTTWDVNDTVSQSDPKNDPDVGEFFPRLPDGDYLPSWSEQRQGGAMGADEGAAAAKAAAHADTPTVACFDALGRVFLTVANNRFQRNRVPVEEKYATRLLLDIENNQREVADARDRIVMRYDYDMLGNRIHQASMEAGERWILNDVAGKPMYSWDSRKQAFRAEYDELRRPVRSHVVGADSNDPTHDILFARVIYGDGPDTGLTDEQKLAANLRGKPYQHFDNAGVVLNSAYDFKGNLLQSSRQLASDYRSVPDWSVSPALDQEVFTATTTYDALNRPIQMVAPHDADSPDPKADVIRPSFNDANLLETIDVWLQRPGEPNGLLDPPTADLHAVTNIEYNAKGQRLLIKYGNGVKTAYDYDAATFRLTRLFTTRGAAFPDDCHDPTAAPCGIQNLRYTYDPVGNITHIQDDAQQTIYFRNVRVEPSAEYTYDAIYRLIEATGREHLGQAADGSILPPVPASQTDAPRVGLLHPNEGDAMGGYRQQYVYDEVGNILEMIHLGTDPKNPGWTRTYVCDEDSQLEPGKKKSNRLTSTAVGSTPETYSTTGDGYDPHGNMLHMPHLPLMQWNYRDQLQATSQQVVTTGGTPETTYYVYDAGGQRVRKVTESQAAAGQKPTRLKERTYLSGVEIYREYDSQGVAGLERETLHVMDDKQRIVLVETRTKGNEPDIPAQLIRYQFGNHLGSASLELDDQAQVISYEEYYPYGSTSYQAVSSQIETPRRYRFIGEERDDETGLVYFGARYYAPWLGLWTSPDPAGISGGVNLFSYAGKNPVAMVDKSGLAPQSPEAIAEAVTRAKIVDKYQHIGPALDITPGKNINTPGVDVHVVAGEGEGVVNIIGDVKHANVPTKSGGSKLITGAVSSFENAATNDHGQLVHNIRQALRAGKLDPTTAYHAIQNAKSGHIIHELGPSGYNTGVSKGTTLRYQPSVTAGEQFADAVAHRQVLTTNKAISKSALRGAGNAAADAAADLSSGSGITLRSLAGGAARLSTHAQAAGMLLWLAFTDDPDRSGSFVGKPMFHPYAKAQQEERNEAFAQSQGWQTWGAMISVMAYHEGCKDCIETFGMDVSQVPDEMWKQASSLTYDPDKALEFLNAKIRARSPSVDAWVPR